MPDTTTAKQPKITVTMPEDWKDAIVDFCKAKGIKQAEFGRVAMLSKLRRHGVDVEHLSEPEGPGRRWD